MRAPSARFLKHTAVVHAPASGQSADMSPITTPGAAGSPLLCSFQRIATSGQESLRQDGIAPFGLARFNLLFAVDPGVSVADQRIVLTRDQDGALTTPLVLASEGPAEPPQGTSRRWTVSATLRS